MCGSAAVPTIRQKTSARKFRLEMSRAASSLPGKASAWRNGGAARAASAASFVHADLAAATSTGNPPSVFTAASSTSGAAFSAFAFSTAATAAALPSSKDFWTSLSFAAATAARSL